MFYTYENTVVQQLYNATWPIWAQTTSFLLPFHRCKCKMLTWWHSGAFQWTSCKENKFMSRKWTIFIFTHTHTHTVVEKMSVFILTGINRHCSLSNTATTFAVVCYTTLNIFKTCFIIRGFLRFLLQLKCFCYITW